MQQHLSLSRLFYFCRRLCSHFICRSFPSLLPITFKEIHLSISPNRINWTNKARPYISLLPDESIYNKESLTAIWQIHFSKNPPGRNVKLWRLNWTNLFDRSTNQPLFPLCLPFCNFTKHTYPLCFLFLIAWWIMWLFLHGCTFCARIYLANDFLQSSESIFAGILSYYMSTEIYSKQSC